MLRVDHAGLGILAHHAAADAVRGHRQVEQDLGARRDRDAAHLLRGALGERVRLRDVRRNPLAVARQQARERPVPAAAQPELQRRVDASASPSKISVCVANPNGQPARKNLIGWRNAAPIHVAIRFQPLPLTSIVASRPEHVGALRVARRFDVREAIEIDARADRDALRHVEPLAGKPHADQRLGVRADVARRAAPRRSAGARDCASSRSIVPSAEAASTTWRARITRLCLNTRAVERST